jgi:hypothetical protein
MTTENTAPDTAPEPDAAAEGSEAPAEATESAPGADGADAADEGGQPDHPSRREARYRTQLRAAEAEREELRSQVESLQRAQVDAAIAGYGIKPKAVWAAGTALADLLGDNGLPDPAKVKAAVTAARFEFGIPSGKVQHRDASSLKSGAGIPQASPPRWQTAFGPRE